MSGSRHHNPQISPAATEAWGQTPAPVIELPPFGADREAPAPDIESGSLLVMRQFDIADEIRLSEVQKLLSSQRTALQKPRPGSLVFSSPPVSVPLGTRIVSLGGQDVEADIVARLFEFGAVSVRLRFAFKPGTTWAAMAALVRAAQVDEGLTRIARDEVEGLARRIGASIKGPHHSALFEDYVVAFVEKFVGGIGAGELGQDRVARLILGERDDAELSRGEVEEATQHRSSYYLQDLCVAGWSTALVVEPTGDTDPVDVLELANAQLLELRYYDELLDSELNALYDDIALRRRGRTIPLFRNYGPVLRRAMTLLLEIAEFVERVENTLKIIGDVFLARLYASAVDGLRIPSWERSVTRKQALVQQVYDVLKSEVDASRGQLLETTVVALIVGEIVLAFVGH